MDNKIINLFLEYPEKEYHVREIAKLTGISPTTASKYLEALKKKNLLTSKYERNHLLYASKTDSQEYINLKVYTNLEKIRTSGLIKFLEEKLNYPSTIILFGSFAKGENISRSDIDIFILAESKKQLALEKYEKILKHEIQLFTFSKQEFNKLKKTNKELFNNIVNGYTLYGFLEVI